MDVACDETLGLEGRAGYYDHTGPQPPAYVDEEDVDPRLLLDVLDGDPTMSIRDDEAEEAWRDRGPDPGQPGPG